MICCDSFFESKLSIGLVAEQKGKRAHERYKPGSSVVI